MVLLDFWATEHLLIRPSDVLIPAGLELVERLIVLRLTQHERFKHQRVGSIR